MYPRPAIATPSRARAGRATPTHRAGHPGVLDRVSRVGYYVHHHGVGHRHRFQAIAAASPDIDFVPISELEIDDGVLLPSDVPDSAPTDPTAGGQLHWAPLDAHTATPRLKTIVDWIASARPSGVVVDVSVEMVLACRLAGVPTVVVRQHGDRIDPAHALAFGCAARLMAPFPSEFETSADPRLIAKTEHVGFIAPPHPTDTTDTTDTDSPSPCAGPDDVVVLWGRGGGRLSGATLDAIAAATPGRVFCAGVGIWTPDDPPTSPDVVDLGWVDDPRTLLREGPLVVGSCGNNNVALVASAECPFVAVPQDRPFDEQLRLAEAMEATGVAVLAPGSDDAGEWHDAISTARRRSGRWSRLETPFDGAATAGDVIRRWLT